MFSLIRMSNFSLLFFCLPLLVGFIEINIGDNNRVNTGTISADCLKGNNRTATENREPGRFSSLVIDGSAFDLNIKEGDKPALSLTADENLLPFIKTDLTADEKLTIRADRSLCSDNPMLINITSPDLQSLSASGANTIVMQGEYKVLEISLSGASELTLTGKAEKLAARLAGSTTLEAAGLTAREADIEARGASSASVHAERSLTARSLQAANIIYSGSPVELDTKSSGAGNISSSHE